VVLERIKRTLSAVLNVQIFTALDQCLRVTVIRTTRIRLDAYEELISMSAVFLIGSADDRFANRRKSLLDDE
jgi:hypothetical protein